MKKIKILTLLTVICNAFILIGAGHGIGILLIFEILSPKFLFTEAIDFNVTGAYDGRLVLVAFWSMIFQVLLILSLFVQHWLTKKVLINLCSVFLVLIFIILTKDFQTSGLDKLSLIGGIPFMISVIFLLFTVNFFKNVNR